MFSSNTSSSLTGGGSLFGSSGGGGGLFGGAGTQQQQGGSLFGGTGGFMSQPQQQTQGRLFGNAGTTGMSLFGQQQTTQPQSGGLFGSSTTTNSGLFGSAPQHQTGGLFGSSGLSQPQQTPSGGGLFGSTNTSTLGSSITGGGLFGQQPQQTGGLFGSSTGTGTGAAATGTGALGQQQSGSLFGSSGFGTNTGGFGTSTLGTAGQQTSGGLFGSQPQGGGLFGSNTSSFGAAGTSGTSAFGTSTFGGGAATGSVLGAGSLQQQQPFQPHKTEEGLLMSICFGNLAEVSQDEERWRFYQQRGGGAMGASNTPGTGLFGQQTTQQPSGGLFGNSTGTTTSGGLFGSTPASTTGTGLLGSTPQTNQQQSGGLFGTSTTGGFGGGLFGSSATTQPSGQQQTGGLFGNTGGSTTTPGGGLFGSSTLGNTTGTGLFGSTTTPQQTQSGGLFGQQQQTAGSGGLFGSSSLTGATNTGGGLFGSSTTPSTGLFGSTTQQCQPGATTTQTGGGLFGSTTTSATTTGQATTGTGLFGGLSSGTGATQGGGLFGSGGTATTGATGGGLFGNAQQQSNLSGGGLFGSSGGLKLGTTTTPGTTPGATGTTGGLFGNTTTTGASGGTSLFGSSLGTSGGGLFGSSAAKPGETGGLFGSSGTSGTSGSLFGNTTGTAGTGTGLLGAAPASSGTGTSGGGLFGSSTTGSGTGLFGGSGIFGSAQTIQQQNSAAGGLFGSTSAGGGVGGGSTLGSGQANQTSLFGAIGSLSGCGAQGAPASAAAADAYGLASLLGGHVEVKLTLSARPSESSAQESAQIFPPRMQLLDPCGGTALGDTGLLGSVGSSVWRSGAPARLCRGRRFRPLGPMEGGLSGSYLSSGASNASFALPEVYIQKAFGTSRTASPLEDESKGGQANALRLLPDGKAFSAAPWASTTLERSAVEALLMQRRRKPGRLTPDQVSPWSSTALQFMRSNPFYREQLAEVQASKDTMENKDRDTLPPTSQSAPAAAGVKETTLASEEVSAPASVSCPAVPGVLPASAAVPDEKRGWTANVEVSPSAKKLAGLGISPIETFSLATPAGSPGTSPNGSRTGPAEECTRWHGAPPASGSVAAGLESVAACLPAPEDLRPVLTRPDYETVPSIEVLTGMTEQKLSRVQDFSITRRGYGSIRWPGYTDLRGINLDEAVKIEKLEVTVYGNEAPPCGVGLNKRAVITLKNCKPRSVKYLDTLTIQRPEDEAYVQDKQCQYVTKVRRYTERMGAKFVDLNLATGEWTFEVEHFSTYRFLDEDDENDEELETQLRQKALLPSTSAHQPTLESPVKVLPAHADSFPASPENRTRDFGEAPERITHLFPERPANGYSSERSSFLGVQKQVLKAGFAEADRETPAYLGGGVAENLVNPEFLKNVSLAESVNRHCQQRWRPLYVSGEAPSRGLKRVSYNSGKTVEAVHDLKEKALPGGERWEATGVSGGRMVWEPQVNGVEASHRGVQRFQDEKTEDKGVQDTERRDGGAAASLRLEDGTGGSVRAVPPGRPCEDTRSSSASFPHLQQRRHCPYPVRCAPVISRDGLMALPLLSLPVSLEGITTASLPGSLVQLAHLSPLLREEEMPVQNGGISSSVGSLEGGSAGLEAPVQPSPMWTVGEVPDESVVSREEEEKQALSMAAQRYVQPLREAKGAPSLTAASLPLADVSPALVAASRLRPFQADLATSGAPYTNQSPTEQLSLVRDGCRVRRTLGASAMPLVLSAFLEEVVKENGESELQSREEDSQQSESSARADATQEFLPALTPAPEVAEMGKEGRRGRRSKGEAGSSGDSNRRRFRSQQSEWWLLTELCRQEAHALEKSRRSKSVKTLNAFPSSGLVQRLLLRLLAFFEQQTRVYSGCMPPTSSVSVGNSKCSLPLSSQPFLQSAPVSSAHPPDVPEASYLAPYMLQTWQLLVALMLSSPEQEESVFTAPSGLFSQRDISPEAILESQRQSRLLEWLLRESGREVTALLQRAAALRASPPFSTSEGLSLDRGESLCGATELCRQRGAAQNPAITRLGANALFRLAGTAGQRALQIAMAADHDEERKLLAVFHLAAAGQLYDAVELLLNSRPGEPYYPHLALCLAAHVQQQVGREFLYYNLFRATAPSFLTPPPGIARLYRLLTPCSTRASPSPGSASVKAKEGEKRKRSISPGVVEPAEASRCASPSKRHAGATDRNSGAKHESTHALSLHASWKSGETTEANSVSGMGLEHFVSWRHQLTASLVFSSASPLEDPRVLSTGAVVSSGGNAEKKVDSVDEGEKAAACTQEDTVTQTKGEGSAADVDMFQRIRTELAPPPQATDAPRELRRALLQFEHRLRFRENGDASQSGVEFAVPASPAPLYRQQDEDGETQRDRMHDGLQGATSNIFDLQYGLLRMHAGLAQPSLSIFDPSSHTPYGLDFFFAWTAGVVTLLHRGSARARVRLLKQTESEGTEAAEAIDAEDGLEQEEARQLHRLTVAFAAELECLPGCWPWACAALLFTPFCGRALQGMRALIGRHAAEFTCTGVGPRQSGKESQGLQAFPEKAAFEERRREILRVLLEEVGVAQWWLDEADGLYALSQRKFMQAAFLFYWAYLRLRLPLVRGFLGSPVAAPLREELLNLWSPTGAMERHLLRHAGRALLQCLPGFLLAVLLQQIQHVEKETRVSRMRRALEKCERLTGSVTSGTTRALSDELRAYERQERREEPTEVCDEMGSMPSVLILSTEAKMRLLLQILEAIRVKLAGGLPDLSQDANGTDGSRKGVEKDILASCVVGGECRSAKFPVDLARLACMEKALRWLLKKQMRKQKQHNRTEQRTSPGSARVPSSDAKLSGATAKSSLEEDGDRVDADFSAALLREVEKQTKHVEAMSDANRGFFPTDISPDEPAFWIALKTALLEERRE
ncbi:nucleoporin autopeptidase [Toxoplasma gondii VAND]|uniref:Nucleoporin autopeptidase n=1 Tax=Toxoplasma gondii VAND TaxID=933077 RepID=A0A086QE37_TOXGO|nr:nucleoporin autopeptidase [Toxoplasma gondii VAND]